MRYHQFERVYNKIEIFALIFENIQKSFTARLENFGNLQINLFDVALFLIFGI